MDEWLVVYREVVNTISSRGDEILFFRGHSVESWELLSGLGRVCVKNPENLERISYFDYVTRSGSLLPEGNSCWNNIFSMQHHGLPTRLLDWTESFTVALYFALKEAEGDCCVWMMDPFELNRLAINENTLLGVSDLKATYSECFLDGEKAMEGKVIAISPLRHHPRLFHQRGGFTIHADLNTPLEQMFPTALTKFLIPKNAVEGAKEFLRLTGITEFSLFPDLDGLARDIKISLFP